MGYLPAALRNYLVRLGWSSGDKEFFTADEFIAAFDLDGIGRSPSRFDFAKLENMNGHFMRAASDDALFEALVDTLPYLPGGPEVLEKLDERKREQLRAAIPGLKERAKTLVELLDGAGFLFAERPLKPDEKARDILMKGGRARLAALLPKLAAGGVDRPGAGGRGADIRGRDRRQARLRRAAPARRPHRPHHLARHLRRPDRARPRGESWADRGSGGIGSAPLPLAERGRRLQRAKGARCACCGNFTQRGALARFAWTNWFTLR